jgi:predicted dehydrogenase
VNLIFEPDPAAIERRLRDEDALDVLVVDDARIPTATHVAMAVVEQAARRTAADLGIDERDAIRRAAATWAEILARARPDIAYVPAVTSYAHAQLAMALGDREVRVVVGTSLEAFLELADDPTLHAKLWA